MAASDQTRGDYHYLTDISTRWSDNDIYGHVNNVVYYSYFDTVANEYLIRRACLDIHNGSGVFFVVSSNCNYFAPIAHPEQIQAGFRVDQLGTKSVTYGLAIFSSERETAVASGTFTHVYVDRASGKALPIPDQFRVALEAARVA